MIDFLYDTSVHVVCARCKVVMNLGTYHTQHLNKQGKGTHKVGWCVALEDFTKAKYMSVRYWMFREMKRNTVNMKKNKQKKHSKI